MKFAKLVITLAISSTALIGDYIVFKSKYSESQAFRAITDGLVHLTIGFWSSILFFCSVDVDKFARVFNVMFCSLMSWIIDVDHVFVAKSIYFKDMSNLNKRGIFHCTTFWLLITTILFTYSYIAKKLNVYLLTYMLLIAYTSHHIRDANRRGLWMYPFGHTPAISKYLYVFLVSIIPHLLAVSYRYFVPNLYKHNVIDYSLIV